VEADLSGTKVIGYSEIEDSAGGQLFRFSDPQLSFDDSISEITVSDAFSNFDGLRRVRIRYDTPDFNGIGVAFAYGQDLLSDDQEERKKDLFDVALRFANKVDAFEVEAAVGYFWDADGTSIWGGSASVLHAPTGLNATAAAGSQDAKELTGTYWYGKVGLLREFFSWGDTGVALDYYSGRDIAAAKSESYSWGLMLVQNINRANTELWVTYRAYQYDDQVAEYEDGRAIFGGARFHF
jgi:Gram-negative porin